MDPHLKIAMNKYGMSFIKKTNGIKELIGNHYLVGYISNWGSSHPDDVIDFIADIDRCINGQLDYDNFDVRSYSIDSYETELVPTGLLFYILNNAQHIIRMDIFPYEDIKILILGWADFEKNG